MIMLAEPSSKPHLPGHAATTQARQLSELILRRVEECDSQLDARRKFVESRFQTRMASHLKRAPWLGFAHTFLGVVAIGGGVATSAFAAGDRSSATVVIVLGIMVATAAGLNQIFKFAKRSAARFRAGNELRREGWDFVLGRGSYRDRSVEEAFDLFYDRIWTIEAPVDQTVELSEEEVAR